MALVYDSGDSAFYANADIPDEDDDYTVTAWVRTGATIEAWQTVCLVSDSGASYDYFGLNDNGLWYTEGGIGSDASAAGPAANTWYWVVCQRSGGTLYLYVDGTEECSAANAGSATRNRVDFGNDEGMGWNDYWQGRIGPVKMWDEALDTAERAQEQYSIRPQHFANLYGFWPTFFGAVERVRDYSGNGRNLTDDGLADEDPPPISYGSGIHYISTVAAVVARQPRYGFTLYQVPGIV